MGYDALPDFLGQGPQLDLLNFRDISYARVPIGSLLIEDRIIFKDPVERQCDFGVEPLKPRPSCLL